MYKIFLTLFFISATASAEDNCAKYATVESGSSCNNLVIKFDFTKCGGEIQKKRTHCSKGEAVAESNHGNNKYIVTYKKSESWGEISWNVSSFKKTSQKAPEPTLLVEESEQANAQQMTAAPPVVSPVEVQAETADRQVAAIRQDQAQVIVPVEDKKAADEEDLKISGYMDLYYSYNSNNPPAVTAPTSTTLTQPAGNIKYRAFDQYHNDVNLSLFELFMVKKKGEVTMKVALDFGRTAEVMSPVDEISKNFTQATITYTPKNLDQLSITAGKMLTHMGMELLKSSDNWNYSRSLLFNYGAPFWHEGLAVSWAFIPNKLTSTFFLYNNSVGMYEDNRHKSYGLQIFATPMEGMVLSYNMITTHDKSLSNNARTIHNAYGSYQFTSNFAAQFDAVYGKEEAGKSDGSDGNWSAANVGVKWTLGSYTLAPRYGYYDDSDAITIERGTTGQKLKTYTLTNSFNLGSGLETRLEFRMDKSDKDVFADEDGSLTKDTQFTTTLGLMFNF